MESTLLIQTNESPQITLNPKSIGTQMRLATVNLSNPLGSLLKGNLEVLSLDVWSKVVLHQYDVRISVSGRKFA